VGFACLGILSAGADLRATSARKPPEVLGLILGESTIQDVLMKLGPAEAASLAGEDSEPRYVTLTDPIVLRFEMPFPLAESHPAEARVYVNSSTYRVDVVTIAFMPTMGGSDGSVSTDEVLQVYGKEYKPVHRRWVSNDAELEGHLSDCDDAAGEVESWIFEQLGLEVEFLGENIEENRVTGLRFSMALWKGEERLPPCERKSPPSP
jgi:hypothetical protein